MTAGLHEEPMFFRGGGEDALFGVFHRAATMAEARPAFVFCHPLAEEKLWTHRVFVSYARRLAASGYPVLRFDLTGNGDSEGRFAELSVERGCADVERAIAEARRLTGTTAVSLLGLRLGATLASLVAERVDDLRHLILWAPIVDGDRYMQDLLRVNVMTQMAVYKKVRHERPELVSQMQLGHTVNVDGYEMGWPLYSSVSGVALGRHPHAFQGPCLVAQIDRQLRSAPDLQRVAASFSTSALEFSQEEPFWKEIPSFYQEAPNLFAVTDRWLEGHGR